MITASHNPPEFNGVKLFGPEGRKLTVEEEFAISADAFDAKPFDLVALDDVDIEVDPSLRERYLDRLFADFGGAPFLSGLQIVLDCARGATAGCATEVFRRAGADVHAIHDTPDGERINLGCGSTHPEAIAGAVLAAGADLGIAFDGDGDRAILVDATGQVEYKWESMTSQDALVGYHPGGGAADPGSVDISTIVVEVLGDVSTPGMEIDVALRVHNIPHVWPEGIDPSRPRGRKFFPVLQFGLLLQNGDTKPLDRN